MESARQPQPPPAPEPRRLPPALVAVATAFVLFCFISVPRAGAQEEQTQPATGEDNPEDNPYSQREIELVELINDYRTQNDREPLQVSRTASAAAEHHSSDMAAYDFFGHDTKRSDYYDEGATFEERLDEEGYDRDTSRGENIASGNEDAQATFEQWKTSPDHDANMLREEFEVIGVGLVCSEESSSGCYWTTDFGGYADESAQTAEDLSAEGEEGDTGESGGDDTNASSTDDSTDGSTDDSTDETGDQPADEGGGDTTTDADDGVAPVERTIPEETIGGAASDQYDNQYADNAASDQYDDQDGEAPTGPPMGPGGAGQEDCTLLQGFDLSPLEPGYSDALQKEIDQFTTCVMQNVTNPVNGGTQNGSGGGGSVQRTTITQEQTSGEGTSIGGGAAGGGGILPEEVDPGTDGLLEDFLGTGNPGSNSGGGSDDGQAPPQDGCGKWPHPPEDTDCDGMPDTPGPDSPGGGPPNNEPGCQPNEEALVDNGDCARQKPEGSGEETQW